MGSEYRPLSPAESCRSVFIGECVRPGNIHHTDDWIRFLHIKWLKNLRTVVVYHHVSCHTDVTTLRPGPVSIEHLGPSSALS